MLNYDNLRDATSGLAALGGGGKGTVGVPVHATLAVAQGGRPLGVCALEGDFRESVEAKAAREPGVAQEPESARWLRSLEQAAAVGHACSNIRVISVADREGDIWGLYARQAEDPAAAGLLVRACRSKQRKVLVDGKKLDLGKHMDTLPPCASRSIEIAARGGRAARKKRKAVLALRIARVELVAPEGKSPHTLPMTAVLVAERNPPSGARQPLRWLLLCSEGEATEWADRPVVRNALVHQEFFRVLKTGTRIEDRRLDDAEDLRKCLAFDAITASRVRSGSRRQGNPRQARRRDHVPRRNLHALSGPVRLPRDPMPGPARLYPQPPNLRHRSRSICRLHPIQTTTHARYRKTLDRNGIPHASHCRTPTDEKGRNAPRN